MEAASSLIRCWMFRSWVLDVSPSASEHLALLSPAHRRFDRVAFHLVAARPAGSADAWSLCRGRAGRIYRGENRVPAGGRMAVLELAGPLADLGDGEDHPWGTARWICGRGTGEANRGLPGADGRFICDRGADRDHPWPYR